MKSGSKVIRSQKLPITFVLHDNQVSGCVAKPEWHSASAKLKKALAEMFVYLRGYGEQIMNQ